jgi:hypothetical protein
MSALTLASPQIAVLGREVQKLSRNAQEYRTILDRVDNPLKPACKDFRIWLKRDYRQAAGLIRKLKRAHEHPDNDLLTRIAIAEQLRIAAEAEAALRAVQMPVRGI